MHVAIVNLTIDPARAPAAAAAFTSEILPRVKSAEGFVGGYTSSGHLVGTGSDHSQCGHPTRGCRDPVMLPADGTRVDGRRAAEANLSEVAQAW
jgi:hypothetical protein